MVNPMPLTVEAFRETFPELTSDKYPDAAVKIRLALANKFFAV